MAGVRARLAARRRRAGFLYVNLGIWTRLHRRPVDVRTLAPPFRVPAVGRLALGKEAALMGRNKQTTQVTLFLPVLTLTAWTWRDGGKNHLEGL
jgi:hypothetical protein